MPTQTEPRSEPRSVQTLRNAGTPLVPKTLPLTDEMLLRFQERAPGYDQENRFFTEDFEELRASGYLNMAIPRELGGLGMTLAEVSREQRRLGYYAPADALAVNMHLYWTGLGGGSLARGGQVARVAPAGGGGRRRARRGARRVGERHSRAPLHDPGRARRGRLSLLRPQALRQPHPGLDAPGHPRHRHQRSGAPDDRPRIPASRWRGLQGGRNVGHAGHAGHPERRHRARRRVRARPVHHPARAGRRGGRGCVRPGRLRVGA